MRVCVCVGGGGGVRVYVNEDLKFSRNCQKKIGGGGALGLGGRVWGSGWISKVFVKIKKKIGGGGCRVGGGVGVSQGGCERRSERKIRRGGSGRGGVRLRGCQCGC